MIGGPPQALIAGAPHRDAAPFATGGGDRRHPHVRPKSGIIAERERPGRFSEHRDGDFSSDSRQGFENGDVAMLAAFLRIVRSIAELLQEGLELAAAGQALRVHDGETRQDQLNLRRHGLDDARGMRKAARL